jgi:hypothetical protein
MRGGVSAGTDERGGLSGQLLSSYPGIICA